MPLSPTTTRELLTQLNHQPKHFLGQNFLVDGNIVHKSLELAGVGRGDTVVEIGPGLGTLTNALLAAYRPAALRLLKLWRIYLMRLPRRGSTRCWRALCLSAWF